MYLAWWCCIWFGTYVRMLCYVMLCYIYNHFAIRNTVSARGGHQGYRAWWLALCEGNPPVTVRSFDVFFDFRLNKRLRKQSRSRWLLSHYDVTVLFRPAAGYYLKQCTTRESKIYSSGMYITLLSNLVIATITFRCVISTLRGSQKNDATMKFTTHPFDYERCIRPTLIRGPGVINTAFIILWACWD